MSHPCTCVYMPLRSTPSSHLRCTAHSETLQTYCTVNGWTTKLGTPYASFTDSANEPTSWISAFLQGALSQVILASLRRCGDCFESSCLNLKKKTSSQDIKLPNGPRSKIYGRLIVNEIMNFRTFVTACLSVFMFVRVTAGRSLLLGIRGVAYETWK